MKWFAFLFLLIPVSVFAQSNSKELQPIIDEGILIYKLETASTYAAELMADKFPSAASSGFLSYAEKKEIKNIVWVEVNQKIIVTHTFHFPDPLLKENASVENVERSANEKELQLINAYKLANLLLLHDPMFSQYNNINFSINLLPEENQTRVEILSGTSILKKIPLGNNYELLLGLNGEVLSKLKLNTLHVMSDDDMVTDSGKSVVTLKGGNDECKTINSSIIATILLYHDQISWNEFDYVTEKNISIYNLDEQTLTISSL